MRGVRFHHGGVGPAGDAFFGNGRGDRLLGGDQRVYLIWPRAGGDHALVLEVVDLDGGIMPVAAD